jgi:protein gp37
MSTLIEWCDEVANPITGCTPYSPGCDRCYAKAYAARLHGQGLHKYRNQFEVTLHPELLDLPGKWSQPKKIFLLSIVDTFHHNVPMEFKQKLFATALKYPQHVYQVLTKRAELLVEAAPYLPWPKNLWMGVTIEADDYAYRAELLKQTPAAVKFVSLEPLLSPLPPLKLDGLDWVIVGGERCAGARKMEHKWVIPIRDTCVAKGIPFFFKKWSTPKMKADRVGEDLIDGKAWREFPHAG